MPKHCLAPVLRHDHYLILTFLHSPFTWAKLCHSLMTIPPCPSGLTSGGIVSFYRRNGIALSSLTGRAGGLPNCLITRPMVNSAMPSDWPRIAIRYTVAQTSWPHISQPREHIQSVSSLPLWTDPPPLGV